MQSFTEFLEDEYGMSTEEFYTLNIFEKRDIELEYDLMLEDYLEEKNVYANGKQR